MSQITLDDIRQMPGVERARQWRDAIRITLVSNGGNSEGERTACIRVDGDGSLHIDQGVGMHSSAWNNSLVLFRNAYAAAGGKIAPES